MTYILKIIERHDENVGIDNDLIFSRQIRGIDLTKVKQAIREFD